MIEKIKNMFVAIVATVAFAVPLATPALAHAVDSALPDSLCGGTNITLTPDGSCATDTEANTKINDTIKLALNLFSAIVGIIAVVMIIVGGIKYITSSGESTNVTSAKNTILYAVIGLVVVALAQIIVKFVLSRFVGGNT